MYHKYGIKVIYPEAMVAIAEKKLTPMEEVSGFLWRAWNTLYELLLWVGMILSFSVALGAASRIFG